MVFQQSSNIRKTIHLDKQKALTVLGSKVNSARNTLTWPSEEKNTDFMLDEIFVDCLWHVNLIPVCTRAVNRARCT